MSEPCPVYGHHAHAAERCAACRAEWLELRRWPVGTRHAQADHRTTPDHAERAVWTNREDEDR